MTEPSVRQAEKYIGRRVRKLFPASETCPGGYFQGAVFRVDNEVEDEDGHVEKGLFFSIEYDDGDQETVTWEDLKDVLVPIANGRKSVKREPSPSGGQDGKQRKRGRRSREADEEVPDFPMEEAHLKEEALRVPTNAPSPRQGVVVRKKGNPGHLLRIKLENFMCHENFSMEFGTHVNVISGTNGSGKSAVLQALQCCLGASARSTGRAPNLSNFIRTGAHAARVQVTIWNTGEDAFQPQEYGETITIERRIGGQNGFKVLNHKMKVVGTSKRDLVDVILDHFSINAANPLAVMTQDTARSFLSGAVADRKKFDLFMEATLLSATKDNLARAETHVVQMTNIAKDAKEVLVKDLKELSDLKARLSKLCEMDRLVELRQHYEHALAWAVVRTYEAELKRADDFLQRQGPKRIALLEAQLAEADGRVGELRQEEKQQRAKLSGVTAELDSFSAELSALQKRHADAKRHLNRQMRETEGLSARLQEARNLKEAVMEEATASGDRQQRQQRLQAYQQALDLFNSQMTEKQELRNALATQMDQVREQSATLQEESERHKQELSSLQRQLRALDNGLQDMERQRRELAGSRDQQVTAFGGPPMVRLLDLIERNKARFSRPPVGPIGSYLNLTNPRWAVAVEKAIGFYLDKFVVASLKDGQLLRELARQASCRMDTFSFWSVNFDLPLYDLPPNLVQGGYQSLLGLLTCQKPQYSAVIFNFLIDNGAIEKTVVCESDQEARAVAYQRAAGPRVSRVYTPDGTEFRLMHGGVAVTAARHRDVLPRLGMDMRQQLRQYDQVLQERRAEHEGLSVRIASLQEVIAELAAKNQALRTQYSSIAREKALAERGLHELGSQAPNPGDLGGGDDDDDGGALAALILQYDADALRAQLELDAQTGALTEAVRAEQDAKEVWEQKKSHRSDIIEEHGQLTESLQALADSLAAAKAAHEAKEAALCTGRQKLNDSKAQYERYAQELQQTREAAEKACSEEEGFSATEAVRSHLREVLSAKVSKQRAAAARGGGGGGNDQLARMSEEELAAVVQRNVDDNMTQEALARERDKLDARIRDAVAEAGGSKAELEVVLSEKEAGNAAKHAVTRNLVETAARFRADLRKRQSAYEELFHVVEGSVNNKFHTYMVRRNHMGKLQVDRDNAELQLLVKINGVTNPSVKAVKDLKQLSGGERSFTTVSFLLALGDWTESPFRAMDEYDVYMDAVNRRVSTETLLEFAMDHEELQFLLLTPQDLQAVDDAKRQLTKRTHRDVPDGFVHVVEMRSARTQPAGGRR